MATSDRILYAIIEEVNSIQIWISMSQVLVICESDAGNDLRDLLCLTASATLSKVAIINWRNRPNEIEWEFPKIK